jgi:hypothetical protein
MKQFLLAAVLMCSLASISHAGEIPSVGAPTPPPPTGPGGMSSTPGEIPISGLTDQLSSEALSALMTMLTSLTV